VDIQQEMASKSRLRMQWRRALAGVPPTSWGGAHDRPHTCSLCGTRNLTIEVGNEHTYRALCGDCFVVKMGPYVTPTEVLRAWT
jgi:hypothetical protein